MEAERYGRSLVIDFYAAIWYNNAVMKTFSGTCVNEIGLSHHHHHNQAFAGMR